MLLLLSCLSKALSHLAATSGSGSVEGTSQSVSLSSLVFSPLSQVQGQPLMVQVSGGQLITSTGQPIMVQAVPGGQGQTIMQVPVSGTQGLQQVS